MDKLKEEFEEKFVPKEYPNSYSDIWQWIEEKLKDQSKGYEDALSEVSKVYYELTNGKLSKPNYEAQVILDEVNLAAQNDIEESKKEAREQAFDDAIGIMEKRKRALEQDSFITSVSKYARIRELNVQIRELQTERDEQ